jgi:hypothetical protein
VLHVAAGNGPPSRERARKRHRLDHLHALTQYDLRQYATWLVEAALARLGN